MSLKGKKKIISLMCLGILVAMEEAYSLNPSVYFQPRHKWIASLGTSTFKSILTTLSTPTLHAAFLN